MADEIIDATSGDSSTPTTDVGTAGAGGIDATAPAESTEQSGAESTQTQREEFSPGWSLDDEQQEPAEETDLTEEQVQQYLTDPRLNQEKAPTLLEDLRQARSQRNELRTEVRQLREQLGQLDQFGGLEGINRMVGLGLGNLMANPGLKAKDDPSVSANALGFLSSLYQQSAPAYEAMVDTLVAKDPDFVLDALRLAGKLPEMPAIRAGSIDPEILKSIPEHLHEQYKAMDPEIRDEYDLMTTAARNFALEQQLKIGKLEGDAQARAKAEWDARVTQAKSDGEKLVEDISSQYEKAHNAELNKWQPLGPDNPEANQLLHRIIIEGAFAKLMEEEQYAKMFTDTLGYLKNAPMRRLHNEKYAADEDERNGRNYAGRFNTRLGQVMKDLIKNPVYGLDSVFRDARQWREHQRQQAPDRKEIPGAGASAVNGDSQKKGSNLNADGTLSDGFMSRVKQTVKRL